MQGACQSKTWSKKFERNFPDELAKYFNQISSIIVLFCLLCSYVYISRFTYMYTIYTI